MKQDRLTTSSVVCRRLPPSCLLAWSRGNASDIEFLKRYGEFCSEYVVCTVEDSKFVEALLNGTDKKIIPIITMESFLGNVVQAKTFMPSDGYCEWLEYIFENQERFPYVLMGNEGVECISGVCILWEMEKRFLSLKKKMVFAQYDFSTEEEARRLKYGDLVVGPIRQFFLSRQTFMNTCLTGFWVLYKNAVQMRLDNYNISEAECKILRNDEVTSRYPYDYYSEFLKSGINMWSGIGMAHGAKNHHLLKLTDFGYKGCMFFIPSLADEEHVNSYFIDIEGWQEMS